MCKLTAFMIVRNEERRLPRCLASLAGVVDDVVIVDTGSSDGTTALLAAAAADRRGPPLRWFQREFDGFGPARQLAYAAVTTPWALWIDADEALSAPLRARLAALRASGELERCDVWEIRIENRVLGRTMRGANLADQYRIRLVRTDAVRVSDVAVHEGFVGTADLRRGRLAEPILHDAMGSWRRYLQKVDQYTSLEIAARPNRYGSLLPLHLLVTGPATLWREYLGRGGWRDGWPGLVWAATTAWSSVLRDLKYLLQTWRR